MNQKKRRMLADKLVNCGHVSWYGFDRTHYLLDVWSEGDFWRWRITCLWPKVVRWDGSNYTSKRRAITDCLDALSETN